MATYTVFVRNWWKEKKIKSVWGKKGYETKLVPNPSARKTVLITFSGSDDEAREKAQTYCRQWNEAHKPGKLSRMAEFTSNF